MKLIPLPPAGARKKGWLFKNFFPSHYRVQSDTHYLCYRLVKYSVSAGLLLLFAILIDIAARTGLLINAKTFSEKPLVLSIVFSHLIARPALVISLLFYLRMRFTIDLEHDALPMRIQKSFALTYTPFRGLVTSILVVMFFIPCLFLSHIFVIRLAHHFGTEHSKLFAITLVFLQDLGVAGLV